MVLLVHPFGNAFVRALLQALEESDMLARFVTTLGWSNYSYPELSDHIRGKLRRNYPLPAERIDIHPLRESIRLLASSLNLQSLTRHERGWASVDRVWTAIDRTAARCLRKNAYGSNLRAVYAYEDCAVESFHAARDLGIRCIYDLPIAYWETSQRLLREEADRYPDWEPTLIATRDSPEKLSRKTRELELADLVICPSEFVRESLPEPKRSNGRCVVAPFGTPDIESPNVPVPSSAGRPLRVLFAGSLSQRKGLADLFAATKLLNSDAIELIVMGSLLRPLNWYRQFAAFTYEEPRPHSEVLRLMQSCDLFVLPSIVEGRALVQQEAMACGLPVIATGNAGADDLIVDGETGFLVPIRSPEAIAAKIEWFASNRSELAGMGIAAQTRARELTWSGYGAKILASIRDLIKT
ncbi:MAG TPA: glycosyltransferase family 4 protein [Chthoniobacterales bacterium]|jgi:glycosyltransferase involved in cell wall biosynthesis